MDWYGAVRSFDRVSPCEQPRRNAHYLLNNTRQSRTELLSCYDFDDLFRNESALKRLQRIASCKDLTPLRRTKTQVDIKSYTWMSTRVIRNVAFRFYLKQWLRLVISFNSVWGLAHCPSRPMTLSPFCHLQVTLQSRASTTTSFSICTRLLSPKWYKRASEHTRRTRIKSNVMSKKSHKIESTRRFQIQAQNDKLGGSMQLHSHRRFLCGSV